MKGSYLNKLFEKCVALGLIIGSLFIPQVNAEQRDVLPSNTVIKPIEMLAGLPKPPFIIEENGRGLQLDLIREAFLSVNHQVSFAHAPLGRNVSVLNPLNFDGIATLPQGYRHPDIFLSKPYVRYENVAITLTDSQLKIDSFKELTNLDVVAFQNAKKFLGDSYHESIALSTRYREIAAQNQQIDMLFSHRTDVIILDISIFQHFLKTHVGGKYNQAFTVHHIFKPFEYSAGFSSKQYRDLFNQGIAKIKEQGVYQLVLDKYL